MGEWAPDSKGEQMSADEVTAGCRESGTVLERDSWWSLNPQLIKYEIRAQYGHFHLTGHWVIFLKFSLILTPTHFWLSLPALQGEGVHQNTTRPTVYGLSLTIPGFLGRN